MGKTLISKKILCFVFGHKVITKSCPVTTASRSYCERCFPISHDKGMSFS